MIAVSKHKAARCRRLSRWHTFPSAHTGSPWAWSNVWRADVAADTRFIWLCFSAEPAAGARHESAGNDSLLASCSGRCYSLRCREEPSQRTQIAVTCSQRHKHFQSFHFFSGQHSIVCIKQTSARSVCPAVAQNYTRISTAHRKASLLSGNFSSSWGHEVPPITIMELDALI